VPRIIRCIGTAHAAGRHRGAARHQPAHDSAYKPADGGLYQSTRPGDSQCVGQSILQSADAHLSAASIIGSARSEAIPDANGSLIRFVRGERVEKRVAANQ